MVRRISRTEASTVAGPPVTRDYRPPTSSLPSWGPRGPATFHLGLVEPMMYDSTVAMGAAMIETPVIRHEDQWEILADSPAIREYVNNTLKTFWRRSVRSMLWHVRYGFAGGENLYDLDHRGALVFRGVKPLHPQDISAGRDPRTGELGGLILKGGNTPVRELLLAEGPRPAKAFWCYQGSEYNHWHGQSRFFSAHLPWQEKNGIDGTLDIIRMWYYKNAYSGLVIRHPEKNMRVTDSRYIPARDMARQIAEVLKTGGVAALPSTVNPKTGKEEWSIEWPHMNGNAEGLLDYLNLQDTQILRGLKIPDDVVAGNGGGFSGRKVSEDAFYTTEEDLLHSIAVPLDEQVVRPGVEYNFGPGDKYRIVWAPMLPARQQLDAVRQAGASAKGGGNPEAGPTPLLDLLQGGSAALPPGGEPGQAQAPENRPAQVGLSLNDDVVRLAIRSLEKIDQGHRLTSGPFEYLGSEKREVEGAVVESGQPLYTHYYRHKDTGGIHQASDQLRYPGKGAPLVGHSTFEYDPSMGPFTVEPARKIERHPLYGVGSPAHQKLVADIERVQRGEPPPPKPSPAPSPPPQPTPKPGRRAARINRKIAALEKQLAAQEAESHKGQPAPAVEAPPPAPAPEGPPAPAAPDPRPEAIPVTSESLSTPGSGVGQQHTREGVVASGQKRLKPGSLVERMRAKQKKQGEVTAPAAQARPQASAPTPAEQAGEQALAKAVSDENSRQEGEKAAQQALASLPKETQDVLQNAAAAAAGGRPITDPAAKAQVAEAVRDLKEAVGSQVTPGAGTAPGTGSATPPVERGPVFRGKPSPRVINVPEPAPALPVSAPATGPTPQAGAVPEATTEQSPQVAPTAAAGQAPPPEGTSGVPPQAQGPSVGPVQLPRLAAPRGSKKPTPQVKAPAAATTPPQVPQVSVPAANPPVPIPATSVAATPQPGVVPTVAPVITGPSAGTAEAFVIPPDPLGPEITPDVVGPSPLATQTADPGLTTAATPPLSVVPESSTPPVTPAGTTSPPGVFESRAEHEVVDRGGPKRIVNRSLKDTSGAGVVPPVTPTPTGEPFTKPLPEPGPVPTEPGPITLDPVPPEEIIKAHYGQKIKVPLPGGEREMTREQYAVARAMSRNRAAWIKAEAEQTGVPESMLHTLADAEHAYFVQGNKTPEAQKELAELHDQAARHKRAYAQSADIIKQADTLFSPEQKSQVQKKTQEVEGHFQGFSRWQLALIAMVAASALLSRGRGGLLGMALPILAAVYLRNAHAGDAKPREKAPDPNSDMVRRMIEAANSP